ncbi:MAG: leucyl aminopeptidase [Acidimicrobiales bacterium]
MKPPRIEVAGSVPPGVSVLGVPVFSDLSTPAGAGAEIERRFLSQRRFEGKPGQAVALLADDATTVVALGVGPRNEVDADALRRAGAALARHAGDATTAATTLTSVAAGASLLSAVVEGVGLGAYRYAGAPRRVAGCPRLERVVVVDTSAVLDGQVRWGRATVAATWRARDWVNRPPRDMTPRDLAAAAVEAAAGTGVEVEVWEEDRIRSERLGGLLGVAAGASEPPRLIRLAYEPGRARQKPAAGRGQRRRTGGLPRVALVGKGITFDSGGLSLKTAAGMMTMKSDMGGAAAVIAATVALAEVEVPVAVTGWVAATENMPGGSAIHPGDVVAARNGTTIEVLNTDAEGRLVLADALSLAAEEKPDAIVDVATLTGGQRVALGSGVAAVMGTDEDLVRRVIAAGSAAGEPAWELPLFPGDRKLLDSDVADLRNVTATTAASSIMAAMFLREFSAGRAWAHLDIAAPAFVDTDDGWLTKGATGWGTRTLMELVRAWPAGE